MVQLEVTTVDDEGRIIIPEALAKSVGLEPRSEALLVCKDGTIVVKAHDHS